MENLFLKSIKQAAGEKTAIAAINILNYNTARAVILAAERAGRPVILQPSAGTVRRYGVNELFRMAGGLRQEARVPVILHLDHCKDEALTMACVDAGWDSVMVDYSALPIEENVTLSRRMVEYAHAKNVAVEGEIGVIAGVEDDISHDAAVFASYDEVIDYVRRSGVDAVAPAIGTAHGVYKGTPVINFDLVSRLTSDGYSVVVHGGTGLSEGTFLQLVSLGVGKINISTALKHFYLDSIRKEAANKNVSPIDFDLAVENTCSLRIEPFIRLFAGEDVKL
jgi:fructose-bisphosphate aldolase class II